MPFFKTVDYISLRITNRAFLSAYNKGRMSARWGLSKSSNPYPDKRNRKGGVTFSRAFRRFWERGYDDMKGDKVRLGLFV